MTRTLRALFLGTQLREKLLLLAFVLIGALWWASSFSTRFNLFMGQQRRTTSALNEQQQWLANRVAIEAAAQKAASKLDPGQTLDGTRLLAKVGALCRESNLRNTASGGLTSQSNGQFTVHTLDYTILRADWTSLTKFYSALQAQSPYIGIDRVQVSADPANPAQLNLALRVSSVEITR